MSPCPSCGVGRVAARALSAQRPDESQARTLAQQGALGGAGTGPAGAARLPARPPPPRVNSPARQHRHRVPPPAGDRPHDGAPGAREGQRRPGAVRVLERPVANLRRRRRARAALVSTRAGWGRLGRGRALGAARQSGRTWPKRFHPQVNIRPDVVTTAVWRHPPAACATGSSSVATRRGSHWSLLSPWPSCPYLDHPKEYSVPSASTAREWRHPHATRFTPRPCADARRGSAPGGASGSPSVRGTDAPWLVAAGRARGRRCACHAPSPRQPAGEVVG